jgi:hypothetical protein
MVHFQYAYLLPKNVPIFGDFEMKQTWCTIQIKVNRDLIETVTLEEWSDRFEVGMEDYNDVAMAVAGDFIAAGNWTNFIVVDEHGQHAVEWKIGNHSYIPLQTA